MNLRPIMFEDREDLLVWRNDERSRAMFISSEPVTPEQHESWFEASLQNPNRFLFIGMNLGEKVGVSRFDVIPEKLTAEVSINLNPKMRGKGLSFEFLSLSIETFQKIKPCRLTATIRPENKASIRCFEKCGFAFDGSDENFQRYSLKNPAE